MNPYRPQRRISKMAWAIIDRNRAKKRMKKRWKAYCDAQTPREKARALYLYQIASQDYQQCIYILRGRS